MPLTLKPVWNTQPSPGEQVEQSLVFPESLDLVLVELDKVPSVINVEKEECPIP